MYLVSSTPQWRQKLFKRIMAKNTLDPVRLDFATQAERDDLIFAILDADGGGFGAVLEAAGRTECD